MNISELLIICVFLFCVCTLLFTLLARDFKDSLPARMVNKVREYMSDQAIRQAVETVLTYIQNRQVYRETSRSETSSSSSSSPDENRINEEPIRGKGKIYQAIRQAVEEDISMAMGIAENEAFATNSQHLERRLPPISDSCSREQSTEFTEEEIMEVHGEWLEQNMESFLDWYYTEVNPKKCFGDNLHKRKLNVKREKDKKIAER